ncbi:MAG TPA: hypothetical protein VET27_01550 [Mycobacterium sp.]|nr:hypothetical protein [Mycobacterium sp.]
MSTARTHADGIVRTAPSGVVTSGVVELAAGALSGWVFAAVRYDGDGARKLRIKSPGRIRQWHLDLIALGTATVALGLAVPEAPKAVQRTLAVGAWSNAMMFLPLAYWPEVLQNPTYRKMGIASFVSTSVGFTGMAATALRRRRASPR